MFSQILSSVYIYSISSKSFSYSAIKHFESEKLLRIKISNFLKFMKNPFFFWTKSRKQCMGLCSELHMSCNTLRYLLQSKTGTKNNFLELQSQVGNELITSGTCFGEFWDYLPFPITCFQKSPGSEIIFSFKKSTLPPVGPVSQVLGIWGGCIWRVKRCPLILFSSPVDLFDGYFFSFPLPKKL